MFCFISFSIATLAVLYVSTHYHFVHRSSLLAAHVSRTLRDDDGKCNVKPVIIIGAGITGAKVAHELSKRNIPFIIVEATEQVGGRMRSITVQPASCCNNSSLRTGFQYELGANWMQGYRDGEPFFDFVDKHVKFQGAVTDYDDAYFVDNGNIVEDDVADPVWELADSAFNKVYALKRAMHGNKSDESLLNVASALLLTAGYEASDPMAKNAIRFLIDFEFAVPANDVSIAALSPIYDPEAPKSEDFFVADPRGYRAAVEVTLNQAGIADVYRSSSKLHLNSPVQSIVYNKKSAKVMTSTGKEFVGSAVVSTVSLGVLQASLFRNPRDPKAIRFFPPLSPKRKLAISKYDMADYLKVFVQFKQPLFTETDPTFLFPLNCSEGGFLNIQNLNKRNYFTGSNAVIVTSTDAYSRDLVCMNRQRVIGDVLEYVSIAVGRKVSVDEVAQFEVPHFRRDPYFRGSYSVRPPSMTDEDVKEFNKPIQTLFFAGEAHNDEGLGGYVHGAWNSGKKTADAVAEFLKC